MRSVLQLEDQSKPDDPLKRDLRRLFELVKRDLRREDERRAKQPRSPTDDGGGKPDGG